MMEESHSNQPKTSSKKIMRILVMICLTAALYACDKQRVFESNVDFKHNVWHADSTCVFIFNIDDVTKKYNVLYNIRNSNDYPFSRIFVNWQLEDSLGNTIQNKLQYNYLFDEKTGRPLGKSGIGDIYSHRFELLTNHQFASPGNYSIKINQFNRAEELKGLISAGLRVEYTVLDK